MEFILQLIALWTAKFAGSLIYLLHAGQASNLPGKIALKINKNIIQFFKFKPDRKIIIVTGTNGKSTTCGLLARILAGTDKKIIYNKSGANLITGIISSLCYYSKIFGKIDADYIIFEVDEASLHLFTKEIKPDLIAITNLYRDQLDRFGELDTTAKLIEKGILLAENATVVLNADDANVAFLNIKNKKIYFGLNDINEYNNKPGFNWITDLFETKISTKNKPETDFTASNYKSDNLSSNFDIFSNSFNIKKQNFFLPLIGVFNFYNALCAISIAKTISSVSANQIQKALSSYNTIFGRAEKINFKNKTGWIYLIKNPAGTTEVLKTLSQIPNSRFLLALNDNYADGRDVSWIWDAGFNLLNNHTKKIFISGKRAYDMGLRIKYANVEGYNLHIEEKIDTALKKAFQDLEENETLYVLPTYTVLLEMQRKKLCKSEHL